MGQLATRNLDDFDGTKTAVRELYRGHIDICPNDPAYYSKVCLVDLREADSPNGFERQNCPLGASIYQGVHFGGVYYALCR